MGASVLELQQRAQHKAADLKEFMDKHKSGKMDEKGQPLFDMDRKAFDDMIGRRKELDDINRELEKAEAQEAYLSNELRIQELQEVERKGGHQYKASDAAPRTYSDRGRERGVFKSLGDMVTESNAYRFKGTGNIRFAFEDGSVDSKTLITTAAGFAPPNNRTDMVVPYANRRPMVADLIPTDPTNNTVIKWMEETTFDNQAAPVAQGGTKPQSTFTYTERTSLVEKIAHWVAVTEEQVDDVPTFQGLINRDLTLGLQLKEEDMLLNGNGSSPQIDGFLHKTGVQSRAQSGTDDNQDTIYKAFTDIRFTGYAEPSGIVMNPANWQTIRLQRTTEGLYIFGDPSVEGVDRLWGKPVIVTNAITSGTALVGDFNTYAHISRKMGIRVDVSDSHDTFFILNQLAVRAELRESLEIKRPNAFEKCTSLN